jgi:hypothetical protein
MRLPAAGYRWLPWLLPLHAAAGDSDGKVHLLDPRAAGGALNSLQLHKPGSKVNAVAVNPAGGASVVLTAGGCMCSFDLSRLNCSRYLWASLFPVIKGCDNTGPQYLPAWRLACISL